ncbi:hypothetical protein COT47_06200 [Candidatus Woesearchaeota archaeon CG08_land_8_20_14_0_20_43_7]|nr:MAG: hypothetical protein COT47_06200 [Candidatus Woesearchaeota archaeon CG08_land_8_20_14_0_20_43_7]
MARGGGRRKGRVKQETVAKVGVAKESGYLYFLDKKGNVSRALMVRGPAKRKKAAKSSKKKAVKKSVKKKSAKKRR